MSNVSEARLLEEVTLLLTRVDEELSREMYDAAADALNTLRVLPFTLAILQKSKAGMRIAKLRDHAQPKIMEGANSCIKVWKKVAEDAGAVSRSPAGSTPKSTASSSSSGAGAAAAAPPALGAPSAHVAPILAGTGAASASTSASGASLSSSSQSLPAAPRLAPTRQRVKDSLKKILAETMTAHFETEAGQRDLTSLGLPVPLPEQVHHQSETVAGSVEAALFEAHAQGMHDQPAPRYAEQFKLLAMNLRRNVPVSANIFFEITTASTLAHMSSEDIANPAMKAALEKALADGAEAVMLDWKQKNKGALLASAGLKGKSGMLKCPRCNSNKTDYYQMQTRSADEPMTTFANCEECGLKWRFG